VSEPFVSQLMSVSFPWAPLGWAQCTGQAMPTQQYVALFSLMGFTFGGDGQNNFNLPNFAGRTVVGMGTDPWNNTYPIGAGTTGPVSIGLDNLPAHTHTATFAPSPAASSATLTGTIDLPLSGAVSGSLGGRSIGGGNNTPTAGEVLGQSNFQVYTPSGGTAVPVPLATLSLQGKLTGTLNSPLTVTAEVPPTAGTISLQAAGAAGNIPLPAPYLVQMVIIATQGVYPMRP